MTYVIGEPCIDVMDRSCVDVCPVEAIFPEDALPERWREFTPINAAWNEGAEKVDTLVDAYIAAHALER